MLDYLGITFRNLTFVSSNKMNHPLKVISFFIAVFFIVCFISEMIFGYIQTNSLYLKDKATLTQMEKDMKEVYYGGLSKKSIKKSWWVRNYNLIFLIRFVIVAIFVYTLQFL